MKVYHRKNFLYGLVLAILGMGLLLVDSLNGFEKANTMMAAMCSVFGAGLIVRSVSSNAAAADKEEEKDHRTQMILHTNRARAFILHRYICLGMTIILCVVGKTLMSDILVFMGIGVAIVYAISIVLDIATFAYYNRKKQR
jgi:hypothetical protein